MTSAVANELEYTPNQDDGIIHMTIADYRLRVEQTYISYDVTDWHEAHFLKLNDQSAAENPGVWSWCGPSCTRHYLDLTSSVAQTVYVTAHTWDKRCTADICEGGNGKTSGIWAPGQQYVASFDFGGRNLVPF